MPPTVIDLRRADDARDVTLRAVQALAAGCCVGFPTENDYVVAGCLRHPRVAETLAAWAAPRPAEPRLSVALRGAEEAYDWAPRLSPAGRRLVRRCWPGPVVAVVDGADADGLASHLPAEARGSIVGEGRLRLRVSSETMPGRITRMSPESMPTVVAGWA